MPGKKPPRAVVGDRDERVNPARRFDQALRQSIHANLCRFHPRELDPHQLRHAAVVLALVSAGDSAEACVLLTERPTTLNRHAGQFALPGGRVDAGELDEDAALRELAEELGIRVDHGAILGRLDDFPTRSGFRIRPFVLWLEDASGLRPDPAEVAACYRVPLAELESPDIPILRRTSHGEHPVLSAHLPSVGHEIFAPTAALLYQFREVALAGRDTRVSHFEQPRFAWT